MKKISFLLAVLVIALVLWDFHHQSMHPVVATAVSDGAKVTKTGSSSFYPDPTLTPGDIATTDSTVVCKSGYSSSVRNVPVSEKRQVYSEYHTPYPEPQGSYEVDHFISLELGGSNDVKNLWPEPANPKPGFHEKDTVENYLHAEVCSNRMTLAEAQREIRTDWYSVYLRIQ